MVVYVGQCGETYSGPTFPEYHGHECHKPHGHGGRHAARVIHASTKRPDVIEFYDARQKARREYDYRPAF